MFNVQHLWILLLDISSNKYPKIDTGKLAIDSTYLEKKKILFI